MIPMWNLGFQCGFGDSSVDLEILYSDIPVWMLESYVEPMILVWILGCQSRSWNESFESSLGFQSRSWDSSVDPGVSV